MNGSARNVTSYYCQWLKYVIPLFKFFAKKWHRILWPWKELHFTWTHPLPANKSMLCWINLSLNLFWKIENFDQNANNQIPKSLTNNGNTGRFDFLIFGQIGKTKHKQNTSKPQCRRSKSVSQSVGHSVSRSFSHSVTVRIRKYTNSASEQINKSQVV